MKKQHGQSMVEFALVAPMLCLMIFGMIWSGFMFMEYLHFSNQVRTVARQIAVTKDDRTKPTFISGYVTELTNLYNEYNMPKMYQPTVKIGSAVAEETDDEGNTTRVFQSFSDDSTDVVVEVSFVMEDDIYNSLPNVLKNPSDVSYGIGFPPKTIKAIQYHMKLE